MPLAVRLMRRLDDGASAAFDAVSDIVSYILKLEINSQCKKSLVDASHKTWAMAA